MSGNLSNSMRANYNEHGVEGYYTKVSESYRNPHFAGLKKVLNVFMDRFTEKERPRKLDVLDLAAGSGEATEVILDWKRFRWPQGQDAADSGTTQPNQPAMPPLPLIAPRQPRQVLPNRPAVVRPVRSTQAPASISGVSVPELALNIVAADPFTAPAYKARTGLDCLPLSFADVAAGQLPAPDGRSYISADETATAFESNEPPPGLDLAKGRDDLYDIVIVSFALHLVETTSELWALLTELSKRARWLVVVAPHKKPDIKTSWGWTRWDPSARWQPAEGRGNVGGVDGDGFEIVLDRVRLRAWRSEEHWTSR